jgi:pyruvate/oxaloacetate carboxyltransferase
LEKAKFDLQVLTQRVDGGMLKKKKSLLTTKKSFESFVQEMRELQKDLVTCERKC